MVFFVKPVRRFCDMPMKSIFQLVKLSLYYDETVKT